MEIGKQYRDNGAIGALLDEYERALTELKEVLRNITYKNLINEFDDKTEDPDCKSIQTILSHVIRSGYGYVIEIRIVLGEKIDFVQNKTFNNIEKYLIELDKMFKYNEQLFIDYPNLIIEEHNPEKKVLTRWGQKYDIEQLMEHAIVHVMRHRRQIERFLLIKC